MTEPRLEIRDHGDLISFTFDDLLKYHGRGAIGGVAHGFKVLERALPLLAGGEAPERDHISIESAFGGAGARDAFEMVTRAVTGGRYTFDPDLAPDAPISPIGRYFFRFRHGPGTAVDLILRPGLILDEFLDLAGQETRTAAEEERLTDLKQEMADRLMSLPAAEVYDARTSRPA